MNKWIVISAWCIGNYAKNMFAQYPTVHDSEEEAYKEMMDAVMYDLSGIEFTIVQDEEGRGFEECRDEDGIVIATIGPDYADVDTQDIHVRYVVAEVGF